jgi:hypothetical protein
VHRTWVVGGVVLIAVGLVWIGQGSGLLRGTSFMVGDPTWAWIGAIAAIIGAGLIAVGRRRRS